MVFGYMIVQRLLPLVRVLGRFPDGVSRIYARLLDAATRPFDLINYTARTPPPSSTTVTGWARR